MTDMQAEGAEKPIKVEFDNFEHGFPAGFGPGGWGLLAYAIGIAFAAEEHHFRIRAQVERFAGRGIAGGRNQTGQTADAGSDHHAFTYVGRGSQMSHSPYRTA